MSVHRRRTWDDIVTPALAFSITFAIHIVAAIVSREWLSVTPSTPVLCLSAGASVGVALSTDRLDIARAALIGGFVAEMTFMSFVALDVSDFVAAVTSHAVEALVATAGIAGLFLNRSLRKIPDSMKPPVALAFWLAAGALGAIPTLALTDSPTGLEEILAHGIGGFAMSSAILSLVTPLLATAHPRTNMLEFVVLLLLLLGTVVGSLFIEPSLIFVILGLLLLLTARFGTRIGPTVALACIAAIAFGAVNPGMIDSLIDGRLRVHTFTTVAVVLTAMVGRLTAASELRIREKQELAGRWKKLAQTGFDGFIEVDASTAIVDLSESVSHVLGMPIEEVRGVPIRSLFTDEGWTKIGYFSELITAGQTVRFDRSFQLTSGATMWALTVAEPRLDVNGEFDGCMFFLLDTTAVHRVNAERFESRAALAAAQESERQRLARLVHDGALQDLAAANLLIGAIRLQQEPTRLSERSTLMASDHLERIESLLVSGMHKLRADAIGDDSIDLRDVDVVAALEQAAAKFAPASTAEVEISVARLEGATPERTRLIVQIAREALVNAILHSEAERIDVTIRRTRDGFSIAVIDDGVGFDATRLQEVGHLGLNNMTALAFQAGGWCSLSTRPGEGTTLEAWVPDRASAEDAVFIGPDLARAQQAPS